MVPTKRTLEHVNNRTRHLSYLSHPTPVPPAIYMMARSAEAAQVPRLVRSPILQRHDVVHLRRPAPTVPAHVQVTVQDARAHPLPVPTAPASPFVPALLVATLARSAA